VNDRLLIVTARFLLPFFSSSPNSPLFFAGCSN